MITMIGFGNPLRDDDGIGGIVLKEVRNLISTKGHPLHGAIGEIRFLDRPQLDIADTETVSKSSAIIFIDSHIDNSMNDVDIGRIRFEEKAVPSIAGISHILSPKEFMLIVNQVYDSYPVAYICAVRGYEFSFGTAISSRAQEHVDIAAKEIERLLKTLLLKIL